MLSKTCNGQKDKNDALKNTVNSKFIIVTVSLIA